MIIFFRANDGWCYPMSRVRAAREKDAHNFRVILDGEEYTEVEVGASEFCIAMRKASEGNIK